MYKIRLDLLLFYPDYSERSEDELLKTLPKRFQQYPTLPLCFRDPSSLSRLDNKKHEPKYEIAPNNKSFAKSRANG